MTLSNILPASAVRRLQRGGKAYARDIRRVSNMQLYFGRMVNKLWGSTPLEFREEVRKQDFIDECSAIIDSGADFHVVSGETLRRWCSVAAHYETFPEVEAFEEVLFFDHFDTARVIGADPANDVTSAQALALAVENDWTADEMRAALDKKRHTDPAVLAAREQFPRWMWGVVDVLPSLNENRKLVEHYLHEVERLVAEDKK